MLEEQLLNELNTNFGENFEQRKNIEVSIIRKYLNLNKFKEAELEDNLRLIEKSEFFYKGIVPMMVLTKDFLKNGKGIFLYPGGHLDFDHALLFASKEYVFVDPIYSQVGVNDISEKMKGLGIKIEEISDSPTFEKGTPREVIVSHAGYERKIQLICGDAVEMNQNGQGPFSQNQVVDMFFLKQPSTYSGDQKSGVKTFQEAVSNNDFHRIIDNIPSGGFYFEAGTGLSSPPEDRLTPLLNGDVSCWTFREIPDDVVVTDSVLYKSDLLPALKYGASGEVV